VVSGLGVGTLAALVLVVALVTGAGAQTSTPATTTTVPKPALSIVGPTSQTIALSPTNVAQNSDPFLSFPEEAIPGNDTTYQGNIKLLIQNSGMAVTKACVTAIGDPTVLSDSPRLVTANHGSSKYVGSICGLAISGFSITSIPLTVVEKNAKSNSMTFGITVSEPGSVAPINETFKLLRYPAPQSFWLPVVIGAIFGAVFFVFRSAYWRYLKRRKVGYSPALIWKYLKRPVYTPTSWTFGGSWVTAISVLGGVLTTVLGASGLIADVFPGIDIQRFVALNLVLAGIVLAGPLIGAALSTTDPPPLDPGVHASVGGLLCAAAFTLVGIAGQLFVLCELALLSNAGSSQQIGIVVAVIIAGLILFWYSLRSVDQLVRLPRPPKSKGGGAESSTIFMTSI